MKLSISNIAWRSEENSEIIKILKAYSISGIEVAPDLLFDEPIKQADNHVKRVRKFWNDNGFDIVAMQALLFNKPNLAIFEDKKNRTETFQYLKKMIELGGKLGAKALVFGSPMNRDIRNLEKKKAYNLAVDFFAKLGDVALKNDTYFCIEPNNSEYGCNFINDTKEAVEIIKKVNHQGFQLHMDTGTLTMNKESYRKAINYAFPYMRHFHISEPFLKEITTQNTDHKKIGKILREVGYNKWVSIEMRCNSEKSNAKIVENCIKYALDAYL